MPQPAKSKPTNAAAKPIEIFRSGNFTATDKRAFEFTPERVARSAAIYDPALKAAPFQRGHVIDTATPAVAWVASLAYDAKADRLRAIPEKVEASFAEEVDAGRYRYVSASFYLPDQPNNPVPGEYYLHHVACLGAAAPAVTHLAPLSFSESADGELITFTAPIDFGEASAAAWRDSGQLALFRSLKNLLIEEFGQEKADRAVPESSLTWLVEMTARDGERAALKEQGNSSFAQPTEENDLTEKSTQEADDLRKQLDAANAKVREATFAENKRYAEDLVAKRKLPSNQVPVVAALLSRFADEAADDQPIAFSETVDGKSVAKKLGTVAAIKGVLDALPEMVDAGEAAKRKDALESKAPATFAAPEGYSVDPEQAALHARAVEYAAKHNVDIVTAAKAVGGR